MLIRTICISLLFLISIVSMNCSLDMPIEHAELFSTTPPESNISMSSDFPSQVPGSNGHGCPAPNEFALVKRLKTADEARFRRGSELNWIRATNGPRSVSLSDSRWAYMDVVVAELRKKDKRWGFTCVWGNCNDPSTDAIAYWCGQGAPGSSTNISTIDIITGGHDVAWQAHYDPSNTNSTARWTYPRPGSNTPPESTGPTTSEFDPSTFSWNKVTFLSGGGLANQNISGWNETSRITSFSMARRDGICIDHTQKNNWSDTLPGQNWDPMQGNPWVFVPMDGKIYAATYEHLRAIGYNHNKGHGQVCKLGHLGSLRDILAGLGPHIKLPPLKTWMPQPGEIVGFAVSTHARYGHKLTQERSDIVWVKIPDYNSVSSGGEIVGRTSGGSTTTNDPGNRKPDYIVPGQCDPNTPNRCLSGTYHPHPKDTLTEYLWTCRNIPRKAGKKSCRAPRNAANCGPGTHFKVVKGQCLPSCGALASLKNVGKTDHQLQPAPQCHTGWTRLGDSYEEVQHGASICCKKISSSPPPGNCGPSPHYKVVNGRCLPSCGALAHSRNVGREDHELQPAPQCATGWTRLGDSYEEAQHGASICCKRISSSPPSSGACLPSQRAPHYKEINGQCLPSCGHAANMAGYGGYGPDGQPRTSDDPHVYGSNVNSCANLTRFGHSDWKNFSWTDRRTSKTMNNSQIYSVIERGGVCCVRGNPRRRPPRTTTTTQRPPTTTTQRPNGRLGQCDIPNHSSIVKKVAKDYPGLLAKSNNKKNKNWEFLEKLVEELRKVDRKWGFYHRTAHNLQEASLDAIAYYCGTGNGNGSSDLRFVDVITSSLRPAWGDDKEKHASRASPEKGYWKYPRR